MHLTLRSALFYTPLLIATGISPAFAQSSLTYICTLNEANRIISVEYSTSEPVPCSVTYTKDDEPQTLWQAESSEGYCEQKAREFVEKQKAWGWQCASDNVVAVGDVNVGDVNTGDITAGENAVAADH